MRKVDFFLIGPPKCGTTALASALGKHPKVFVSDPKEPNYFFYAGGNPYNFDPGSNPHTPEQYEALFRDAPHDCAIGDASTIYFLGNHCAEEIYRHNQEARILCVLRNPVERAYSMYLFWNQNSIGERGIGPEAFRRSFISDGLVTNFNPQGSVRFSALEWMKAPGYYGNRLSHFYEKFPQEQIYVGRYAELVNQPQAELERIIRFVGVDTALIPRIDRLNVTQRPRVRALYDWLNLDVENPLRKTLKRTFGGSPIVRKLRGVINKINQADSPSEDDLPDDMYFELIQFYRDDLFRLSEMTGKDFTDWLTVRREKPLYPADAAEKG